ncbi:MAG TPA: hypothetical protein DDY38_01485 [Firmicutes bacterium]|nr:hypothetical protein [Bacillota bacterium]
MEKKGVLTKVQAVVGTALVWVPILSTLALSVIGSISNRVLRFDYLLPAELFPFALVGSLLLLWAALRARSHQKLIASGLGTMLVFLIGGQAIAIFTDLASGAAEPTGWPWGLVVAFLALYSLALIATCIAGLMLVKNLFILGE